MRMYFKYLGSCSLAQCLRTLALFQKNVVKAPAYTRSVGTVSRKLPKGENALHATTSKRAHNSHRIDRNDHFNANHLDAHQKYPANDSLVNHDTATSRLKLEKKLQARLRDGRRARDVKSLKDPLVQHLLRLAGTPSYRRAHGSIIVSGSRLVTELTTKFPCKRLIVRRQSLSSIWKKSPHLFTRRPVVDTQTDANEVNSSASSNESSTSDSPSSLSRNIELHSVSNRILKKVAGLHSYEDGCIAEMHLPEPTHSFGNIRLLLCIGHISDDFYRAHSRVFESGAAGTLIRTAGALHWQGVWMLPSCPDVFNPVGIRASQGALFWLPYRFGNLEELLVFCRKQELALCVPGFPGSNSVPLNTPDLFTSNGYKGVCLIIDSFVANSLRRQQCSSPGSDASTEKPRDCSGKRGRVLCEFRDSVERFSSDLLISLDERIVTTDKLKLLHPITVASLMLYYIKKTHFPSTKGSAYVYTLPKHQGA